MAAGMGTRDGVGRDAEFRDPAEHDERIPRAPAQRLRAREQEHQIGVVWLPLLHGAPRQIVEGLEFAARGGRLGIRPAAGRVGAGGGGGLEQEQKDEEHGWIVTC